MYAQRGHGKRSSYYSDYTFGVWTGTRGRRELVPVGKAYFGFTDEELKQIDKFVRDNTIERFGPVRSVRADEGSAWCWKSPSRGSTAHQRTVRRRHALSTDLSPALGQAGRTRPTGWTR